jgi:hypothetical protein
MKAAELERMLEELASMPGRLDAAARQLEPSRWPLGPAGGFCLIEQAWHLADLEREGYGERIRRLLAEEEPHLPDFEGARLATERSYRTKSLADGIAAFTAARSANLAVFRSVPPAAWSRAGSQEGVGRVTLRDLPRMMREHDESHCVEIADLLRAEPGASPSA